MELKDKIIILRKKENLSQEQLAEKLNVTRQTVSKWELGETKPNIDVLNAMAKLFDVNIEVLTNDELKLSDKKDNKTKKPKNRKYILYILIVILIVSIVTLVVRIGNDAKNKKDRLFEWFNSSFELSEISTSSFNFFFKEETTSGFFLKDSIDEIISSNKKNKNHLIEVVFNGNSYGTTPEKIKTIKNEIDDSTDSKYDISLGYDKKGYVNKVTITTLETVSVDKFNRRMEFYSGTEYSTSVGYLLDEVIKSNNKYKDHLVEVVYENTSYGTDANRIREIKKSTGADSLSKYEVSLEYDEKGYVIKITIEKI